MTGRILRLIGKRTVLAFAFVFTSLSFSFAAAPPANDTCAGAVAIPVAGPFPYLAPVVADISGATSTGDPVPLPDATCQTGGVSSNAISRSIWYRFAPTAGGLYTFSTSFDTATTVDTAMAIYSSSGGCAGPFQRLDCDDDQSGTGAALSINLASGTTYYIVIWATSFLAGQSETAVQLRVTKPAVPPNDTCAGAEVIPASGPFPYLSTTNDITLATTNSETVTPSCAVSVSFLNSVWFRFTPSSSGTYLFSTRTNTATTMYETIMGLYRGSASCNGFVAVACNYVPDTKAAISSALTAGTNYYIVVWNSEPYSPGETLLQLRVSRLVAPSATTLAASNITAAGAVLTALVNPNESQTRFWFQWGTTTNYGNLTTSRLIGSGASDVLVTNSLTGLTPGTLYHYRVVATNLLGMTLGADRTFSTRIQIASLMREAGGAYRIRFMGIAGRTYRVEASANLTSWSDLGAATDTGGGSFQFLDTNAPSFAQRFYRIRE